MIRMEYTGPIPELQGKTALVREPTADAWPTADSKIHVLAQFDDINIKFNGQRMGFNWHPFLKEHFTPIGKTPVF